MNTHNNKRRQDTMKRIETAFLELLKSQELARINVSQLCQMANINRGTFYANFEDIYHLAAVVLQRLEVEVSHLLEIHKSKRYTEKDFLLLFVHIRHNPDLYRAYFRLVSEQHKELQLFSIEVPEGLNHPDMHITFFMNGFNGLVKKWMENGFQQTPEQMLDILLQEYQGRICWQLQ